METFDHLNTISLKYVPEGLIDNMAALVQILAWCWSGDKPLPEPMLTQFTDAYMQHKGEMSWLYILDWDVKKVNNIL